MSRGISNAHGLALAGDRVEAVTPSGSATSARQGARLGARVGQQALIGASTGLIILVGTPATVPLWLRGILSLLGGLAAVASLDLILGGDRSRGRSFLAGWLERHRPVIVGAGGVFLFVVASGIVLSGSAAVPRGVLAAAMLLAPGYFASRLLLPEPVGSLRRLALAWALSAGLIPLPLALLNWAGVAFSLPVAAGSALALTGALGVPVWKSGALRRSGQGLSEPPGSGTEHLLLLCAVGLTVLLAALPYLAGGASVPFGRDYQHPVNVAHILANGWPWPQPAYIHRTYPDSFGYLASAVAALTGWSPLQVLKVLPVLSLVGGALALYCMARSMFGRVPAALALLVYGALSYEPRSNFFFGTDIDLVAGLSFVPLFLWMLTRTTEERGYRAPLLAGLLAGFIIQYHLLTTTLALAVALMFLVGVAVFRRNLLTNALLRRLAFLVGVAMVSGLPSSLYYAHYYVTTGLSRLGILHWSQYDVTYPAVRLPQAFIRIGLCYLLLPLAALLLLHTGRRLSRPRTPGILLAAWLVVLLLGSFTKVFVDPARSAYLLALPGAVLLGLAMQAVARRPAPGETSRQPVGRRRRNVAPAVLVLLLVGPGIAFVAGLARTEADANRFAEARDLPSLHALQRVWQDEGSPHVLADESGLWAHYFTDGQAYILPGGPAGLNQWYPQDRERYLAFWAALQAPCAAASIDTLRSHQIRFIYLGARPRHWTKQGYQYNDGGGLLACPGYSVVYTEDTPAGAIRIFRVDGW